MIRDVLTCYPPPAPQVGRVLYLDCSTCNGEGHCLIDSGPCDVRCDACDGSGIQRCGLCKVEPAQHAYGEGGEYTECAGCFAAHACADCGEAGCITGDDGLTRCEDCMCGRIADGEASTHDTLAFFGMTHRPAPNQVIQGAHEIVLDGEIVFTGNVFKTTAWLRAQGLITSEGK